MRLYHRTFEAESILASGFKETVQHKGLFSGVPFSDRPSDPDDIEQGDAILAIDVPDQVAANYVQMSVPGRYNGCKYLLPTAIANRYGPPRLDGHDHAGATKAEIRRLAAGYRMAGNDAGRARASHLVDVVIPLLEHYAMLGAEVH
jgi:hypothetical protein